MNKRLFLLRHAEVDRAYRGRYLGSTDISLSEAGLLQATELGKSIAEIFHSPIVWLSPLQRCQQSWKNLALSVDQEAVQTLDLLREINFGSWEGKSFGEIYAQSPEAVESWGRFDSHFRFPEGESLAEFIARMEQLKDRIIESTDSEILLITHGGVISTLICLFLGLPAYQYILFHTGRPSLSEITVFENGKGVLRSLNLGSKERLGEWPG